MIIPPVADSHWDPPAFDLTELRVCHFDEQGQAWHPYAHLQLGTQEAIGEVERHSALSFRLVPIYVDVVAPS